MLHVFEKMPLKIVVYIGTVSGLMGKPMLRVGLLAWATSCGGFGCAVAADKREVPDVDNYVENPTYFCRVDPSVLSQSRHGMSQDRPEAAHKSEAKTVPNRD